LTPDYPVTEHVLGNGLRVVVSEDHAVPTVTVHLHYRVGSRQDPRGLTGLAHFFEHQMFEGSRNVRPGEHASLCQSVGAVLNGGATADLTMYFEHVPAGALDLALWLEADRMATLAEGLDQARLDAQRGVITQEWHQVLGVPYGDIPLRVSELVYPAGHPYRHLPIGSLEDLRAATLDDVAGFFRTWYTPGNAVLAITGDVTPGQALAAAERYFGPVPAGREAPDVPALALEPLAGAPRDDAAVQVPFAVAALGWRLPPNSVTDPAILACDLALQVLAGGEASRAHQALVREMGAAQQVSALTDPRIAGNSLGMVTAVGMPGADPGTLEKALLAELDGLAASGPGEEELACAKAAAWRRALAGLSSGPGSLSPLAYSPGRAAQLAYFTAAFGDPRLALTYPGRVAAVTAAQVRQAAAEWLRPGSAAIVTTRPALPPAGGPTCQE
jgi:zinc protease